MIFKKAPIVSLQGQPALLFTEQQPTLLQALEFKKVKVFSECRSGFCGACKTKVYSGTVRYLIDPVASFEADECLPCCCIPETDLDLDLSLEGAEIITRGIDNSHVVHAKSAGHKEIDPQFDCEPSLA